MSQVLGGVFVTYLFLQTFAIPGSIFLSIVSGYLFPFPVALLLVRFSIATVKLLCHGQDLHSRFRYSLLQLFLLQY